MNKKQRCTTNGKRLDFPALVDTEYGVADMYLFTVLRNGVQPAVSSLGTEMTL